MNDLDLMIAGLAPLGMMIAGTMVIWIAGARQIRHAQPSLTWTIGCKVAGGTMILLGLIAATVVVTQFLALYLVPVLILVVVIVLRRYYLSEQQSLLWVLLTAAERGIPLDAAARSFAGERNDSLSKQALKLADYLEAGVPLGLALQRSGYRVDQATLLAADLGCRTGTLGPALRQVIDRANLAETVTTPVAARLVYLGLVVVSALLLQSYLMFRVVPTLVSMQQHYGIAVPVATSRLSATAERGSNEWWIWVAFLILGFFGFCVGVLWLLGFSLRRVPIVRRFWWGIDSSLILRWLATGVRQGRPIVDVVRLLAGYFPQPSMRRVLEKSAQQIAQGRHWCDSLLRNRIIRRSDSTVLKAAERSGNLAWALDEMADSSVRRWVYRLQFWTSLTFPVLLIVLGIAALGLILGIFTPLLSLIRGLA